MKKFLFTFGLILLLGMPAFAATLFVTKTADTRDGVCDGDCSLREAVSAATPGDVIQFQGGGIGLHQLEIGAIAIDKENITIDGGAVHQVVIRGKHAEFVAANNAAASFNCFTVQSSNNTFKGLVVQNCYTGIYLFGKTRDAGDGKIECLPVKGNKIENTFLGTNDRGEAAVPNQYGVYLWSAQENIVGPHNLISGNSHYGMVFSTFCTNLNQVEGNIIGLKATGDAPLMNSRYGIVLSSYAKANIVGGETPEKRNIISGNNWAGILITGGAEHNIIEGNYIGTDLTGKKKMGNGYGVMIGQGAGAGYHTNDNIVRRNVISGQDNGVGLRGLEGSFDGAANNVIEKNIIGLAADLSPLDGFPKDGKIAGNFYNGIFVKANNNIIGGDTQDDANIIARNGSYGIEVAPSIRGNRLKINSISLNFYSGIHLADITSHNNIAKPAGLMTAEKDPAESDKMLLRGEGVKPSAKVDVYEFEQADYALRARCQGKTFIGTTTADEAGRWELELSGPFNDVGKLVTAVQTDNTDGFSPFADCFEMDNKPPHLPDLGDRGVTETQELAFNLNGVDANGNGLGYSCARDCPEGLTVGDDGQVRWTPARGAGGRTYNVAFAATDGVANDEKVANIIVESFDTAPQLADLENKTVFEKDSLNFSLEAMDEDGDAPVFVFAQGRREGMEFDAQTGAFSWSSKKEDIGEHRLVFRARDNDKEHLFTEKEMKIEVKRKFPPPSIEIKKLKVVRAGEKISLIAQLNERLPELQYTFRWEMKDGEGGTLRAEGAEAEYTAPITDEDVQEQIVVAVEDSEGNVSEETVNVVVLAKSVENPNIETPVEMGDGDNLGNLGALGGGGGTTETEAGGEAEKGKGEFSGLFQCALQHNAAPAEGASPFAILLLTLWALKKRIQS